jgi:hypothetical protein
VRLQELSDRNAEDAPVLGDHSRSGHDGLWPIDSSRRPVLNRCDTPACVLVGDRHLFDGTPKDNSQDMVAKGRHGNLIKTACANGHPYDVPGNMSTRRGFRECMVCKANSRIIAPS